MQVRLSFGTTKTKTLYKVSTDDKWWRCDGDTRQKEKSGPAHVVEGLIGESRVRTRDVRIDVRYRSH